MSDRKTKTATISLRIDKQFKDRLQTIATTRGHTLSSLLVRIFQDFLKSYERDSALGVIQKDRRNHLRTKVTLPALWKFRRRKGHVEHGVLVKNISAGGAYTEYIDGKDSAFLKDLQGSALSLVVRMPGSKETLELDSEVRRINITEEAVGVALRFINSLDEEILLR